MIQLIGIVVLFLFIIILFSFPQFSPIPYFPSNMKDKKQILKGLMVRDDQLIIDLGAGDGVVVFEASYEALKHKLNTTFIALEINPILIGIIWIKWLFHPNRKNIKIIWGDMFTINFNRLTSNDQRLTTFYLYISPWLIERVISRIKTQLPLSQFVSYYYPIKSLKKKERILKGIHNTYLYN